MDPSLTEARTLLARVVSAVGVVTARAWLDEIAADLFGDDPLTTLRRMVSEGQSSTPPVTRPDVAARSRRDTDSDVRRTQAQDDDRRTVDQVVEQQSHAAAGGCCERFGNQQGCDCLSRARRRENIRPFRGCTICSGWGYTGTPGVGSSHTFKRCPAGCPVKCSVCSDPNCDTPGGKH